MICEACEGEGYHKMRTPDGGLLITPCLDCMGSGIASCCDTAGSSGDPYRDDKFEPELCHHCGMSYRGPALYCSLTCAVRDA